MKTRLRSVYVIKMTLRGTAWVGRGWIYLDQNRDQWREYFEHNNEVLVSKIVGKFLSN
jgi:hypothetical protein